MRIFGLVERMCEKGQLCSVRVTTGDGQVFWLKNDDKKSHQKMESLLRGAQTLSEGGVSLTVDKVVSVDEVACKKSEEQPVAGPYSIAPRTSVPPHTPRDPATPATVLPSPSRGTPGSLTGTTPLSQTPPLQQPLPSQEVAEGNRKKTRSRPPERPSGKPASESSKRSQQKPLKSREERALPPFPLSSQPAVEGSQGEREQQSNPLPRAHSVQTTCGGIPTVHINNANAPITLNIYQSAPGASCASMPNIHVAGESHNHVEWNVHDPGPRETQSEVSSDAPSGCSHPASRRCGHPSHCSSSSSSSACASSSSASSSSAAGTSSSGGLGGKVPALPIDEMILPGEEEGDDDFVLVEGGLDGFDETAKGG